MPLTDLSVRNAKPKSKTYRLADGGCLYLDVTPSGNKLWRFRYRIAGRGNMYAIGRYPDTSLAEARIERDAARKLVKQGISPTQQRRIDKLTQQAERGTTFKSVAQDWVAANTWTARYHNQITGILKADVYPSIGALPIQDVTPVHILDIMRRVESRGAVSVAILIRQWCSAIFRYGVATLRATGDPASALKGAITRPRTTHSKPLSRDDLPVFMKAIDDCGGHKITKMALRLLMMTFVRSAELRGARWDEFDLDQAQWRIPAERMKMNDPHIVPLSLQAVELLRELHTLTGQQQWSFPNVRRPKDCMSATSLNRFIERMGYAGKFSAHGARATASTILHELGYPSEVIERQLAHAERNAVRAAYNQAVYLKERARMMQAWSDLLAGKKKGKVIQAEFGNV